jgi:tRNA (uracil-5-)-methyltransferase
LNNCLNIDFICAKLEECIEKVFATKVNSSHSLVVVLDPPRNGAHPSVIKCLKKASIASKIDKIVYVSCSPAQASINFDALMRPASGKSAQYLPVEAVSMDLFPHTKHCELVVAFEPVAAEEASE